MPPLNPARGLVEAKKYTFCRRNLGMLFVEQVYPSKNEILQIAMSFCPVVRSILRMVQGSASCSL